MGQIQTAARVVAVEQFVGEVGDVFDEALQGIASRPEPLEARQ